MLEDELEGKMAVGAQFGSVNNPGEVNKNRPGQ